ncbi:endonuclease/exonuclease/phosphatase family protein [Nocardioides rotundus]|uniref:endonuclease/exonuclease/phosphatase family protein n=1 Tax=Nocardioides rotundus TaxID=1774216 RepID=UPI001CBAA027|nr:endonuclease/exonuclease/phosphatase family protein [Nocardioides rotundus]
MRLSRLLLVVVSLALGLTLAVAPAQAASGPPERQVDLQVMSYNMRHGEGVDGVLDLDRIAGEIRDSGAEVVALQEVDNNWGARSDYADQAKELADRLGWDYAYAANLDLDPLPGETKRRQYGTAVLSRYPILSSRNHLLTNIEYPERPTEQRGLLETVVNVRGAHVSVLNTHLDHQRAEQRISQVREILAITDRISRPTVLMGDLNALPDTTEVRMLTPGRFVDAFAGRTDADTYPAEAPDRRIDYILGSNEVTFSGARLLTSQASDHLPLLATASFTKVPNGRNR